MRRMSRGSEELIPGPAANIEGRLLVGLLLCVLSRAGSAAFMPLQGNVVESLGRVYADCIANAEAT